MAERTHNKPSLSGVARKDKRPSQTLSFSFLFDRSITDNSESGSDTKKKKEVIPLKSNEITFFQSQKSVWFRQLLKP
jgi:hypothetical protein